MGFDQTDGFLRFERCLGLVHSDGQLWGQNSDRLVTEELLALVFLLVLELLIA